MRIKCEIKGNDEIGHRILPNMNRKRLGTKIKRERKKKLKHASKKIE